ncbi:Sua5/YciO/YrdC/YwlC family protein [Rhodocytophaga aerolata]|uniref:L-threonylcarbamoyladenylate synthase n=1 Tax=Rhodocytophaga aerolata TaxID=455078 RepID=A0ABT8QYM0_9BACT|nr:Sua5/YciO/YrdC/YwlC family protein [Rhodocytophaga aerolata]MDO1444935.1 Sua5/YciO/YrdC/YwlC family protein [Rhodocytophaga aerolata]
MMDVLQQATDALRAGKLLLYPTDTVWSIGCDVRNEEAVTRIHQLKNRNPPQPFTVLIAEIGQLHDYVQKVPDIAWDIVEFAEKPLTVVYAKGKNVAPGILAADGSIAIQLVKDEFCQKLIRKVGRGVVYTSANVAKQAKPFALADVDASIQEGVDYIVQVPNRPATTKKLLPTIFRLELNGQITFIRK